MPSVYPRCPLCFVGSVGGAESNPHSGFSPPFLPAFHPAPTDNQYWPSRDVAAVQHHAAQRQHPQLAENGR